MFRAHTLRGVPIDTTGFADCERHAASLRVTAVIIEHRLTGYVRHLGVIPFMPTFSAPPKSRYAIETAAHVSVFLLPAPIAALRASGPVQRYIGVIERGVDYYLNIGHVNREQKTFAHQPARKVTFVQRTVVFFRLVCCRIPVTATLFNQR